MKSIISLTFVAVMITSCVEAGPNFERMTAPELAAYNENKPVSQMIVCAEDDRTFSRVRRRRCATVEQMYGSEAQAGQLDVQNSAGVGSSGGAF